MKFFPNTHVSALVSFSFFATVPSGHSVWDLEDELMIDALEIRLCPVRKVDRETFHAF